MTENLYLVEGIDFFCCGNKNLMNGEGSPLVVEFFPVGGNKQIFSWWGDSSHSPPVGKTMT